MKNNYREALQRAQKGTTIRPPKKYQSQGGVPGTMIQASNPDGNVGNTTNQQTIIEDFNQNGIPDYLEVKQTIPMVGASNVPNFEIDPTSGGTSGRGSYNTETGVFPGSRSGVTDVDPTYNMAKKGIEIGKDSYMAALKAYKNGGSKR